MQTTTSPARDPLARFYTKDWAGATLVELMRDEPSTHVLDLGAGLGALSRAARSRWEAAKIVSVDIDSNAEATLRNLCNLQRGGGHEHFAVDALAGNLPSLLRAKSFGTAVCNPPYAETIWKPAFSKILEEGGLGELIGCHEKASTDILFLAQNLRMLDSGGQLGVIVPDGIVSGRKSQLLRRALLSQHRVECVVQLPRGSFLRTEAQAFILILSKGQSKATRTLLMRLNEKGKLSQSFVVERAQAEHRLDFDFYSKQSAGALQLPTLQDLSAHVVRGSLENAFVRNAMPSVWAFHTTDFPCETQNHVSLPHQTKSSFPAGITWAEPGDILIARVDRSLHKKVCFVTSGSAPLTECVFRVRLPMRWRGPVFKALTSIGGKARLLSTSRGVAARMIAKYDLVRMPLDLPND